MIWGHVIGGHRLTFWVFVFHLPLFFLVSGYFMTTKQTFVEFSREKVHALIIPYIYTRISICALSVATSLVRGQAVLPGLLKILGGAVYGSGNGAGSRIASLALIKMPTFIGGIWFLLALFWALVITRKVLDANLPFLHGLIVVAIVAYADWTTSSTVWLPWDIQPGCVACIYVYAGFWLRKSEILNRSPSKSLLLACLFVSWWRVRYFKGFWMISNYLGNGLMDISGGFAFSYLIFATARVCEGYVRPARAVLA